MILKNHFPGKSNRDKLYAIGMQHITTKVADINEVYMVSQIEYANSDEKRDSKKPCGVVTKNMLPITKNKIKVTITVMEITRISNLERIIPFPYYKLKKKNKGYL